MADMKPKGLTEAQLQKMVKNADADRLMKQGDKACKKTLFQWKPDWDSAAQAYDKAGSMYKASQEYDKAAYAYERAAEAHYRLNLFGLSAKAYENVALSERDAKNYPRACEFFRKCSDVYVQADQFDRGAEALIKAAKLMQDEDDSAAVEMYKAALTIYKTNEREHMMGDAWRAAIACMVKATHIFEAIELMKFLFPVFDKLDQKPYKNRACLSIIVFKLHLNDYPGAMKEFRDFCGDVDTFGMSEEGQAAQDLLQLFDEGDVEGVAKLTAGQPFVFLENRVARLAKDLSSVVVKKEGLGGGGPRRPAVDGGDDSAEEEEVDPML